jgi:hypothetical protein
VPCVPWDTAEQGNGGMDPVTVLVHSSVVDVDIVFVDGEVLVSNGKWLRTDEDEIAWKAKTSVAGIQQRSDVGATDHISLKYT